MAEKRTLIDTLASKLYEIGEGGYEIKLSPGSKVRQCERSPAGHMMIPFSEFATLRQGQTQDQSLAYSAQLQ